ncbi:MAG: hypothetical protein CSB33_03885 [Desulfobacterales bacterium]|nr:MAG: hypothetical protein CSB33_03885 [Desulfobacterales bacterium]
MLCSAFFLFRRPPTWILILSAITVCCFCAPVYGDTAPAPQVPGVVFAMNDFGFRMTRHLPERKANLVYSPGSIYTALAMTAAGSAGETAEEFDSLLGASVRDAAFHRSIRLVREMLSPCMHPPDAADDGKKGVTLYMASRLFPLRGAPLRPDFLSLLREYHAAGCTPVDYVSAADEARDTINSWTREQTQGKIPDLVPPGILDALTRLVLVNAVYFKGDWMHPFAVSDTASAPFHREDGEIRAADFMTRAGVYRTARVAGVRLAALPYEGDAMELVLVLPSPGEKAADLEDRLTSALWRRWMENLGPDRRRLFLPRFSIARSISLKKCLSSMGIPGAFERDRADFSGMDGKPGYLYISAALHKAVIEVNETGTEAAATTGIIMAARGVSSPMEALRFDRPFLFFIREKTTGLILFSGRFMDPSS